MRKWFSFSTGGNAIGFEQRLYQLVNEFEHAVVLTDKYPFYNGHAHQYREFDILAGFGALDVFTNDLRGMESVANELNDWLLGYFSYDLKNDIEPGLNSKNKELIGFQHLRFFRPRYILRKSGENWHLGYDTRHDTPRSCNSFLSDLRNLYVPRQELPDLDFKPGVTRRNYRETVEKLKDHIRRGDIYEVNYCMDYYAREVFVNPALVFEELLDVAPMPFSALVRDKDAFLMGASPERYLRKRGARIISQPMKGTVKRNSDSGEDFRLMKQLAESDKERAENIMIADLVRNDLSRTAARGTVKVDDLCSVFPYPGVYQMISTISAQMHSDARWLDPVRSSFPMGSMTGAPKYSAMQLIDRYEKTARGLYSGSVGYVTPEMDFDFNVVIRSFLYNQRSGYLSYTVGSAITDACDPSAEYDECILKAQALRSVFNKKGVKYGSFAG
ncbi:MAG: anthranilate synthase component I family protein [Marinilabilia sp.]